ncbi:MAG: ankyrin repeat domain-containing protein [Epsilonproteobacteria bacterium]|nr:ankyrin repeat domain-containing protein [Campylobacterota bacterium]NPA57165.1 ankyrin repeat domain-containing protein [Campylobacterota bacterium]
MEIFDEIRRDSLVGVKKIVQRLGENINELKNENGESPLLVAIKSGASLELFEFLVEHGGDIFETDEEGVGLIDEAIRKGRLDVVKYLVDHGIDPNTTKRKSGFTPLMAAMAYGDEPITRYLLKECGVDPTIRDTFDKTAADYARMTGYGHLVKILEE